MGKLVVQIDFAASSLPSCPDDWVTARWLEGALNRYFPAGDFRVAKVISVSPATEVSDNTRVLAAQLQYLSETLGFCFQDKTAEGLAALVSAIKN